MVNILTINKVNYSSVVLKEGRGYILHTDVAPSFFHYVLVSTHTIVIMHYLHNNGLNIEGMACTHTMGLKLHFKGAAACTPQKLMQSVGNVHLASLI